MTNNIGLRGTKAQAKTRLLLALWDLAGTESEMNKSDLTRKVKRKGEKGADYKPIYSALVKQGAIAVTVVKKKPLWEKVKLTEAGLQVLSEGLQDKSFAFDTNVGARTANALLKWFCSTGMISAPATNGNGKKGAIVNFAAPSNKVTNISR